MKIHNLKLSLNKVLYALTSLLLIFVLLFLDNASGSNNSSDATVAEEANVKIGFVVKSLSDQFFTLMKAGAENAAEKYSVQLTFLAPNSENDVAQQVELVESMITAEVDVLCICPANDETLLPVLERASDAGIQIIAVDSDSSLEEKACYIGTMNEDAAYEGALWIGRQLSSGSSAVILRGRMGDATHDKRVAGITAALTECGINILEIQAADSDAENGMLAAESLLQKYSNIDLIITTSDTMATGARNAVEVNGTDTVVYGFDGTLPVAEQIASGEIIGSTAQHPYDMGYIAVKTAVQIMNGAEVNSVIDSGYSIVTSENVKNFISNLNRQLRDP